MFDKIIAEAEAAAADHIRIEQGDYYEDGLLYCGKCHTAKQVKVRIFGIERKPYCLCKCAAEQRAREERERRQAERQALIRERRRECFPDRELMTCTFGKDDGNNPKIGKICRNYSEKFADFRKDGKGLLLFGTVGTGKTFYAAAIANELIDRGYSCLVTNFSRLVNTIQGMYTGRQEYIDALNGYDLLVIDDLAAERNTEYMNEIVYSVIDSRNRAGLPLIITTNLTSDELKHPADMSKQRIYSRLFEMCIPIEVTGTDRRRDALKRDYAAYLNMLNE